MKIVEVLQGTHAWHAYRATHWNASDAPAMLGISPYKSREQLVREYATGIAPEIDADTQARFDEGHRTEALARPLAEQIIGEELYPCVGEVGLYSASFDGLTLLHKMVFEHKSLNDALRAAFVEIEEQCGGGALLPEHYQAQMEQQCMVSGAERVLFMASKWNGDQLVEERHCWYTPDSDLRARIVAGWERFGDDVCAYQPEAAAPVMAAGRAPEQLPALRIELTGMVTASNLGEFRTHAMGVLGSIKRDLRTDEDFADAEKTVKWCADVEGRIAAAKQHALSQTASIEELFRALDDVSGETRRIRLELDKLVKAEKESRKAEIVREAIEDVRAHYAAINRTLGEHALGIPASLPTEIGAAIKGLRTLSSITDASRTAAANAKISGSQQAERVRACMAALATFVDHTELFPDRVALCASKAPEDLANLARARIHDHMEREAARRSQEEAQRAAHAAPVVAPVASVLDTPKSQETPTVYISVSDINKRISPLLITADGLREIGFNPANLARNAKLYDQADFPEMCRRLERVLQGAREDAGKL